MPTTDKTKPFKSYAEQIRLLQRRGLVINDEVFATKVLQTINYYRLSAYSLTLRENDNFYESVTLENVLALYRFDEEFKRIIMKYSLYVEISARAYIAYYHAKAHSPIGYLNNQNFENELRHAEFLNGLFGKIKRSSDVFVIHHRENKNGIYPIWVAVEEMDFGMLSKFYKNMLLEDRKEIAKQYYSIPADYVETCLQCTSVARNIAAHGGRFYNRKHLRPTPKMPSRLKFIEAGTAFTYVYAIYALLLDERKEEFTSEMKTLFANHTFAQEKRLGFPEKWDELLLRI